MTRRHRIEANFLHSLLLSLLALFALLPPAGTNAQIPSKPADNSFVNDFAGLIYPEDLPRIAQAQKKGFDEHNTPIIVVTIPSMKVYGREGTQFEQFASDWFDAWQIGTGGQEGGNNKGVLLLVSVGDRNARIELGKDWGPYWDTQCERTMSNTIIPLFKQGNYSGGIAAGVEELVKMAAIGPEAEASDPVPPIPYQPDQVAHAQPASTPVHPHPAHAMPIRQTPHQAEFPPPSFPSQGTVVYHRVGPNPLGFLTGLACPGVFMCFIPIVILFALISAITGGSRRRRRYYGSAFGNTYDSTPFGIGRGRRHRRGGLGGAIIGSAIASSMTHGHSHSHSHTSSHSGGGFSSGGGFRGGSSGHGGATGKW